MSDAKRLQVAVYDRHWPTAGGGEKYAGGVAEVLSRDHEVTLIAHEEIDTGMAGRAPGPRPLPCQPPVVDECDPLERVTAGLRPVGQHLVPQPRAQRRAPRASTSCTSLIDRAARCRGGNELLAGRMRRWNDDAVGPVRLRVRVPRARCDPLAGGPLDERPWCAVGRPPSRAHRGPPDPPRAVHPRWGRSAGGGRGRRCARGRGGPARRPLAS